MMTVVLVWASMCLSACSFFRGPHLDFSLLRAASATPQSAPFIDMTRYSGLWYEIAHVPNVLQPNCQCSTVRYQPINKKTVQLVYHCLLPDGKQHRRSTRIFPVPGSQNARYKATLIWPLEYDSWILYVDPDYRYALVGTPNRKYLWVLSRTSRIPDQAYHQLLLKAAQNGYNVRRLTVLHQRCEMRKHQH